MDGRPWALESDLLLVHRHLDHLQVVPLLGVFRLGRQELLRLRPLIERELLDLLGRVVVHHPDGLLPDRFLGGPGPFGGGGLLGLDDLLLLLFLWGVLVVLVAAGVVVLAFLLGGLALGLGFCFFFTFFVFVLVFLFFFVFGLFG